MLTIPGMSDHFEPLDRTINEKFLPALLGMASVPDNIRKVFALPARLGGLGIPVLQEIADEELQISLRVIAPLVMLMVLKLAQMSDTDEIKALTAL